MQTATRSLQSPDGRAEGRTMQMATRSLREPVSTVVMFSSFSHVEKMSRESGFRVSHTSLPCAIPIRKRKSVNDLCFLRGSQAVDKLVSRNGKFALGFFTSGSNTTTSKSSSADNTTTATNWYLGIWFNKIPDFTPVWIANRDEPITHPADLKLQISRDGNLVVLDHIGAAGTPLWSTEIINAASKNSSNNTVAVAVLSNNGNLVIRHASDPSQQVWWQSFDYPSDVFLPGSKLGRNKVTGLNRVFISKKNRINPGSGSYCVGIPAIPA
ncbi:hypothetical protein QYE76_032964 [Lolium multiflorum]|uniref:non-specific serine/threonine protein kinase n=1 Tax=Lolium multiflorum TaxID=4521 RepID=A0AAD8VL50_LOLMU|nr:hypothetical protein QYE76_032964 [Lolium multiflorum]